MTWLHLILIVIAAFVAAYAVMAVMGYWLIMSIAAGASDIANKQAIGK